MWQHNNYIFISQHLFDFCHMLLFITRVYYDLNITEQHDSTHLSTIEEYEPASWSRIFFVMAPASEHYNLKETNLIFIYLVYIMKFITCN